MRALGVTLALALLLAAAPAAAATELLANPGLEVAAGTAPAGWTPESWGTNTAAFSYPSTGAHGGERSVRVDVTSYASGDAKWVPDAVEVTGGAYYVYSDWYRSDVNTAVSVYYERAEDPDGGGTWANLFSGIAPAPSWTRYQTGFTMPAGAVRAVFVHFVAGRGFLQTDDHSLTEQAAPAGFTTPMVSLTFDNASKAFYDLARPMLDARSFRTTQYVPTYGLTTKPLDRFMMTADQLRALLAAGHEIGSHSVTHPDLVTISDAALAVELRTSKAFLESITGAPVTSFAYPFGSYDARVIEALRAAGYTMARSVEEGYNSRLDLEPYDIRVQNILRTTTTDEVRSWIEYAAARGYWLVLVYHEVVPDGAPVCTEPQRVTPCLGPYDTTASGFEAQLDALARAGLGPVVMPAGAAFALTQAQLHGPAAGMVAVVPRDPPTDAVLTAEASGFTDPDGDPLTFAYQWLVGGTPVAGATRSTFDLGPPGHGDDGDVVGVEVRAADPAGNLSPVASASVTVHDPAPAAGGATPSGPAGPAAADRRPPAIRITSPRARQYRAARRLLVRFSCSDTSGVSRCRATVRRAGGKARAVRSGRRLRLRPGLYVLRVSAQDRAGNTAARSVRFRQVRG